MNGRALRPTTLGNSGTINLMVKGCTISEVMMPSGTFTWECFSKENIADLDSCTLKTGLTTWVTSKMVSNTVSEFTSGLMGDHLRVIGGKEKSTDLEDSMKKNIHRLDLDCGKKTEDLYSFMG